MKLIIKAIAIIVIYIIIAKIIEFLKLPFIGIFAAGYLTGITAMVILKEDKTK